MARVVSAQVAADLRAAADVLERDGWTQGEYHRLVGNVICHCAEGAVALSSGGHDGLHLAPLNSTGVDYSLSYPGEEGDERRQAAEQALEDFLEIGRGSIPIWNDKPGRTAAEVIAALRAAADRAEAAS